jgi:hypothetical protein
LTSLEKSVPRSADKRRILFIVLTLPVHRLRVTVSSTREIDAATCADWWRETQSFVSFLFHSAVVDRLLAK